MVYNYSAYKMGIFIFLLINIVFVHGGSRETCDHHCCTYCRAEPLHWMALGGNFELSGQHDGNTLDDPAAYMIDDEGETLFALEQEEHLLEYAGAPIQITVKDLNDHAKVIDSQYVAIDFASPVQIGGLMIQGGFYHEKLNDLYPHTDSWATEFVVSYSNYSTTGFQLYKNDNGNVKYFAGNTDARGTELVTFSDGITARYIRYHPMRGQSTQGATDSVNVRVNAMTCSEDECHVPRINCLLTDWSEWSSCDCDETSCTKSRDREIRRVQACGGSLCPSLRDSVVCDPPEPLWKTVVQFLGISLGAVLVIGLVIFLIYKKTQKNKVHQIILVSDAHDGPTVEPGEKVKPKLPKPEAIGIPTPNAPAPNKPGPRGFPGMVSQPGGIPGKPVPRGPFGGPGMTGFGADN